jgi:hypothetical protein
LNVEFDYYDDQEFSQMKECFDDYGEFLKIMRSENIESMRNASISINIYS